MRRFENRLNRVRAGLDNFARSAIAIGVGITAAAVAPVLAFAKYESELAKIEGLVGVQRSQLTAWRKDIERIAISTGIGPEKLAEALFFITSAGFRGATALAILEQSAKASAAGMGDQAVIADLLTSAIGVYGEEILSSAKATDQLTAAIREGKLDPTTLARPLAAVLPFAQQAGVEFGEVAGAMAAMSRQGIAAERSATALRGIFVKLLKPTEGGKKALAEVGLSIDDIRKAVKEQGLLAALRTLRTAFGDNTDAIGKVFEDSEALLGVFALTGPKAQENADIIDKVTGALGTLDEALKPVLKTLEFQWKRAFAAAKVAMISLGETLSPVVKDAINQFKELTDQFNALNPATKKMVGQALLLGPALIAAGVAAKGLSIALGGFALFLKPFKFLAGLFARFAPTLLSASRLIPGLGILTTIGTAIYAAWKPLSTFFTGLFTGLSQGTDEVMQAFEKLQVALGPVGEAMSAAFGDVRAIWNDLVSGFDSDQSSVGVSFGKGIIDGTVAVITAMTDLATWLGGFSFTASLETAMVDLKAWFEGLSLYDSGVALINTLTDGILAVKDQIYAKIKEVLGPVGALLPSSDAQEGPLSRLTQAGRAIVDTMVKGVEQAQPLKVALLAGALALPSLTQLVEPVLAQAPELQPIVQNLANVTSPLNSGQSQSSVGRLATDTTRRPDPPLGSSTVGLC